MTKRIVLQQFIRDGNRLVKSVCLCSMMFLILLMANDQTRLAKLVAQHQNCCEGRSILLSILSLNTAKRKSDGKLAQTILPALTNISTDLPSVNNSNFTPTSDLRDTYYKWIPHPQQEIASLSDNPYVIKNSHSCQGANIIDIIVLIHSAAGNFKKRQGIRHTWGNITRLRQKSMKIVFLLGLTESSQVQTNIYKENGKYNDIVQGNFMDAYTNLTHKSVLGLRWVTEFCNKSRKVMKIDDDVFIDTVKLFTEFDSMFKNKPNSIYCNQQRANTSYIQRTSGKWKVDEDEFRNHTFYPLAYCHGFFILMSTDIASKLYKSAYEVPFFWIDDIYVYGMLTDQSRINENIVDVGNLLSLHTYNSLNCFGMTEKKCNLLVGNAPSQEFMESMWEKMLNQSSDISHSVLS